MTLHAPGVGPTLWPVGWTGAEWHLGLSVSCRASYPKTGLDNGKGNGNCYSMLGLYTGVMEKNMETTIAYWGYR